MNKKAILKTSGICVVSLIVGWFARGLLGGGGGAPPMMGQMPPASVMAQRITEQRIQPIDEYIAAIEPIQDVMIRAEVPGTIKEVHFTEGALVEEGDLLFTIDPAQYQATVDAAKADWSRAKKLYDRMKSADVRSISKSDLETAESDLLRAEATLNRAQIDLDYTAVKAPIRGRIGAAKMTKGNYVTSSSGALARIVQVDPIRVVFSLTDRDYLAFRKLELSGSTESRVAQTRLPDGTVLPTLGKKDFDDNAINPETGTIAVRYLFENPDGLLIPGGYVTALLRNSTPEMGIRIPQKAVLMDQQGSYVLTVDAAGTVAVSRIVSGIQLGADVVVLSGLESGELVIVDGLQKAQPGATVHVANLEEAQ